MGQNPTNTPATAQIGLLLFTRAKPGRPSCHRPWPTNLTQTPNPTGCPPVPSRACCPAPALAALASTPCVMLQPETSLTLASYLCPHEGSESKGILSLTWNRSKIERAENQICIKSQSTLEESLIWLKERFGTLFCSC
jgi:hypothetical protein